MTYFPLTGVPVIVKGEVKVNPMAVLVLSSALLHDVTPSALSWRTTASENAVVDAFGTAMQA
jgi:hypothetical protein